MKGIAAILNGFGIEIRGQRLEDVFGGLVDGKMVGAAELVDEKATRGVLDYRFGGRRPRGEGEGSAPAGPHRGFLRCAPSTLS